MGRPWEKSASNAQRSASEARFYPGSTQIRPKQIAKRRTAIQNVGSATAARITLSCQRDHTSESIGLIDVRIVTSFWRIDGVASGNRPIRQTYRIASPGRGL